MGVGVSRKTRAPVREVREIIWVPDRDVAPLKTLDELLEYQGQPLLCVVEPLSDAIRRGEPGSPRTIFCHDMDNNYKEDRFIYGCEEADVYRFYHWQIIDTFIYYSHHMVTIPPPGWISAAHRHGVNVLGTFILGSNDIKTINRIRGAGLAPQVAAQLAKVAAVGRFDGWLVSIGCNMLNEKNACFFNLCDGIFLNFRWTEAVLRRSAQLAGDRKADVYAGVDVFARNTWYIGGYGMYKAVQLARRCGVSAAVFAAGWVYQTQGKKRFARNQYKLWSFPDDCCSEWCLTKPPLTTSFCQGFGSKLFKAGRSVHSRPWFNLHKQQLQPRDQGESLCDTCCSVKAHTDDAYDGGCSLRVLFKRNPHVPDAKPYIRLFGCDFPLGSLEVSYTFKNLGSCTSVNNDISIVLKARNAAGEIEEVDLGVVARLPEGDSYAVTRQPDNDADETGASWVTRKYHLEDLRGAGGAVLREIGLHFLCTDKEPVVCLLGRLDIRRPGDTDDVVPIDNTGEKTVLGDDSDSDEEPEAKRLRDEQYGFDVVQA
ncbi:hypothetical protein HPB50_017152 [Hyalomma asiaticum]|uniref:Uncharacterized protein n=1 Tax=Hyalomma asiaticum TaxID=266040 RepID=A0ACB7T8D3_HYAAI|nr:hypothetical protein HPB50_017152 [Hyalomma asiaticum]